jgi:hypothetical protein
MTNFTQSEKTMLSRIAIEMAENNIEPNHENIKATFKKILRRKTKTAEEEKNIVRNLLKPEIMAKVDKKVELILN